MFTFGRKKTLNEDDESFHDIEKVVQKLEDGNGRVRIVDLEAALQRIDQDIKSKPDRKKQVRKFSECIFLKFSIDYLYPIVTSLKPKNDRIDGEKFLQIMLERQKQLKLRYNISSI
jgi:hypothetical protein